MIMWYSLVGEFQLGRENIYLQNLDFILLLRGVVGEIILSKLMFNALNLFDLLLFWAQ